RGAFQFILGTVAETVGLETPGDLQLAEVRGIYLIQGTVPRAREVGRIGGPFGILGADLPRCGCGQDERRRQNCTDVAKHQANNLSSLNLALICVFCSSVTSTWGGR